MRMNSKNLLITACLVLVPLASQGLDFTHQNACTIRVEGRKPVTTTCVSTGCLKCGKLDVEVKTPDGKVFAITRRPHPVNIEEDAYSLQGAPARLRKGNLGEDSICYQRLDQFLDIWNGPYS